MKNILFTILMIVAFNINATTYYETSNPALDSVMLDGGHSIVDTTTGLEWLSFKDDSTAYTLGHSIVDSASWYSSQGWVLATETQVLDLFNVFFPTFTDSDNGTQTITPEDPANLLIQSRNSWLLGFGHNANIAGDGTVSFPNETLYSTGMYLRDNGTIGIAGIKIGVDVANLNLITTLYGPDYGIPSLTIDSAYGNLGVFMVRSDRGLPPVPIPAAIWLFGTGLLGLIAVARRKT